MNRNLIMIFNRFSIILGSLYLSSCLGIASIHASSGERSDEEVRKSTYYSAPHNMEWLETFKPVVPGTLTLNMLRQITGQFTKRAGNTIILGDITRTANTADYGISLQAKNGKIYDFSMEQTDPLTISESTTIQLSVADVVGDHLLCKYAIRNTGSATVTLQLCVIDSPKENSSPKQLPEQKTNTFTGRIETPKHDPSPPTFSSQSTTPPQVERLIPSPRIIPKLPVSPVNSPDNSPPKSPRSALTSTDNPTNEVTKARSRSFVKTLKNIVSPSRERAVSEEAVNSKATSSATLPGGKVDLAESPIFVKKSGSKDKEVKEK